LLRNIGIAFLQQGIYTDARDNFEAVLRIRLDMVSAYNRLIATYMITKSVEQSDALKQAFQDMLCVPGLVQAGADIVDGGVTVTPESEVCTASLPCAEHVFWRPNAQNMAESCL
jgi:hypothetical protein